MAVAAMKSITVCGLKKNRKAVLEYLQRRGAVQITDGTYDDFSKENTLASQGVFKKAKNSAESAIAILGKYIPEKTSLLSSLDGRKTLSKDDYYSFVENREEIMRCVSDVLSLSKSIENFKSDISALKAENTSLIPWLNLDIPLNFKGTKFTHTFIGTISDTPSDEILKNFGLKAFEEKLDIPIHMDIINSSDEQTCLFVICHKSDAENTEKILREIGFAYTSLSTDLSPKDKTFENENKIKELEEKIAECEKEISAYSGFVNSFKFMSDYWEMRIEKYKALGFINNRRHVFVISGYAPTEITKNLEYELEEKYNTAAIFEDIPDDENSPVLLENNGFSAPLESVIESYSLPGKGEIDPTFIMSLFYYVLFGMMLSDCAYGLIIAIGCAAALGFVKSMENGLKKTLKMFMICGISTAFWGLMFGSFFGDAITVISETYFGHRINFPTLWFVPLEQPMRMLMFAFLIGIIHIFVGLGISFYQLIKQGKIMDAISDVVFWYMLVGGGIVYLFSVEMFLSMSGIAFKLSPTGAKIAAIVAILGAIGILFTAGRSSKNPFKRFAKGLYALYNVTGYLSDILSYSRLLALGLATGVIAQVFNKMGAMVSGAVGNGIIGFLLFLIVFVIGHTMNIGINLLGAYVHTNRLQFVEFFGKFYEGGGEKYTPFAEDTKYYKIKEEI